MSSKGSGFRVQGSAFRFARRRSVRHRLAVAGTATHYPLSTIHFPLLLSPLLLSPLLLCLLPTAYCLLLADDIPSARGRIEAMTAAEKEQLGRRQEQFAKLDSAEQQRLRRLHRELDEAPELREVLDRYHRWLMTLSPYERESLLELDPAERVQKIRRMRREEARVKTDIEGIFRWLEQYAAEHEAQILKTSPQWAARLKKLDPEARKRSVMWIMLQRWQARKPGQAPRLSSPRLPDEELAALREQLSPGTRAEMEQKTPKEQWRMIAGGIRRAFRHQMAARRFRGGFVTPDLQQKLDDFFEHELSEKEQGYLLGLPADEMRRELQRRYLAHVRSSAPAPSHPPEKE